MSRLCQEIIRNYTLYVENKNDVGKLKDIEFPSEIFTVLTSQFEEVKTSETLKNLLIINLPDSK